MHRAGSNPRPNRYRLKLSPFWRDGFILGFPERTVFVPACFRKIDGELVKLPKSVQRFLFGTIAPKGNKVFKVKVWSHNVTFTSKGFRASVTHDTAQTASLDAFIHHPEAKQPPKRQTPSYAESYSAEALRAGWRKTGNDNYILRDLRNHGELTE